ncbi:MAG TPA: magnesium-translocating P-type ATPase [Vicinamibacterales bacterium]|nr:magnesium-translocating P-type ATPase [Vicinamibacterales bacterium]
MADAGLTSDEAARRLTQFGPNEPVHIRRFSAVHQLLRLFANPLVLILLVAALVSSVLGQQADAGIIVTIVVLGVGLNFWQTFQSNRAADALNASVMPTATVLRDGQWREVPLRTVVPGDVFRLSAGDLVPADAQLIDSRDLSVQQAALTGESLPADKHAPDSVLLGTSVISGTGTALATATGPRTQFGGIAERLTARPPETEFEHGLHRFSALILKTTLILVLFILTISLALRRDPFESLLFAVALGVGLTPEFLPVIASIALTKGAVRMAREHVIVKRLPAIQNFGSIDVLCSDKTGTLTSGRLTLEQAIDPDGAPSDRVFTLAYINSRLETGIRSPLDAAVLQHRELDLSSYTKLDELPFDFERRRLSIAVQPANALDALLVTKGAPEPILDRSIAVETAAGIRAMSEADRAAALERYAQLTDDGLRVIGVAYRTLPLRHEYGKEDERELVFAGFLAFSDPLLPGVASMIAQLKADGVAVKILTGDSDAAARHVCAQVAFGLTRVVTGDDIARMNDDALAHVVEEASVFTRVSPAQKSRIILALKRRGHVVGFIGDGINDAPSLHIADVGISVMSATDVARAAADVILREPGLDVLHRGIIEGRRASGNMTKYLLMGTSSNFGNMFSMAVASAFLPFLPMLPTQILLNSFLYDLAQITIPSDNVDREYLSRPQRWNIGLIRNFMLFIGPVSSVFDFLTFYVLLRVFHAGEPLFHTGWFVESLATQTLVLFVIRTNGNPLASRPSRALTFTTLAVVGIGASLPLTPLAGVLGFVTPPLRYGLFVAAATLAYLVLVQVAKAALVSRHASAGNSPAR